MTSDMHRGHRVLWLYADTRQPVAETPNRDCGFCGLTNTSEGHDGCLGTLPGVINACCGHGQPHQAFVQYDNEGGTIFGERALAAIGELKRARG